MSFDISQFETASGADEGRVMEILTPSGNLMLDKDKKPVTVTLLGRHAEKVRKHQNATANRRLEQARRGRNAQISAETIDADAVEYLTTCTVAWTFDELDGKPFPCTPENARAFWSDRRFLYIREQADRFIADDGNFTTR